MPRLALLLMFLLDRTYYIKDEATPLQAAAFSILPQATRIHETRSITTSVQTIRSRDFSTSMTSPGTSFESAEIPKVGKDGLYHITTEEEYRSILEEHPDKLIILKVFSPWCKTCKAMAPKFQALAKRVEENSPVKPPIVWVSLAHSKAIGPLVRSELGVNAVPSVVFHVAGEMVDSFRCGPSKVATILRPKLAKLIANHVDHSTGTLKTLGATTSTNVETTESQSQDQGWNIRSKWQSFVDSHNFDGRQHGSRSVNTTTIAN